jgi:hypothetical protein
MKTKIIKDIINNYAQEEKSIVDQLYFKLDNHYPTIGGFREEIWKQMFEQIIPKKFAIEQSVFLIDSKGDVSKEVDLAIFDEVYTPYIFRKGRIKFIPIEAVAVAVQCKSTNVDKSDLINWCESITKLKTSRNSVARMHGYIATNELKLNKNSEPIKITQSGTRPILILCSLDQASKDAHKYFDFMLFTKVKRDEDNNTIEGNIIINVNEKNKSIEDWFSDLNHNDNVGIKGEDENIDDKYKNNGDGFSDNNNKSLNEYRVLNNDKEISLLSLNFQLNQLLMLINNPMLFPHMAYVEMFNRLDKKLLTMEKILSEKLKVISPMFSYGASSLEARPSELKGLIRYIYRISNITENTKQLYYDESELFGGTTKNGTKKVSPLRMILIDPDPQNLTELQRKIIDQKLILRKEKEKNYPKKCFSNKKEFELKFFYHDNTTNKKELNYENLFYLSLILGGIGKRSRRGRGCMTVDKLKFMTKIKQIKFVTEQLNCINQNKNIYEVKGNEIIIKEEYEEPIAALNRPVIKIIIFGEKIRNNDIEAFLLKVDNASHEIKDINYNKLKERDVKNRKFATGYAQGSDKFASSVIISITETNEGFYPVYTFVTPVLKKEEHLDKNHIERNAYFKQLEGRRAFE